MMELYYRATHFSSVQFIAIKVSFYFNLWIKQLFCLVLERIIHRLIFYSKQIPDQIYSTCMARVAGGGNCNQDSCKPCVSQRVLRIISDMTNTRDFGEYHVSGVLHQWDRLFTDSSILPSCFKITGNDGFLYQIGRTFVLLHQMDCINLAPYSDATSDSYRFEKKLDQVLG